MSRLHMSLCQADFFFLGSNWEIFVNIIVFFPFNLCISIASDSIFHQRHTTMFTKPSASSSSWYQLDSLLEAFLPRFYESERRVVDDSPQQPQDIDEFREDMYESALADSEFAQWLNCPPSPRPHSNQNDNALERLRMLVVHLGSSLGSSLVSRPSVTSSSRKEHFFSKFLIDSLLYR
ncbi:hypothetical protein K450DRAFT_233423 [Umbelopsis ramanniana AG]|uniref:Uncharacterized protein n=1 Tax=Umbelopsis ramanniana AG TaxID=1314678 RepID=A0AAD5ECW4_UMBRA|nr:uncharacterized protein K450DRAFT_233423 [Umbelopsis ramanniana AG]KAI8581169.1 hypothetical protein K450DRAFT_233423 [Umbelopsis ramanniana AG]